MSEIYISDQRVCTVISPPVEMPDWKEACTIDFQY